MKLLLKHSLKVACPGPVIQSFGFTETKSGHADFLFIIAVIPANVDVATQEMLDMAEEIDKSKDRTLGVLTKPDLVDRGARHEINSLIEGKAHKLTLGWYMVRNPGQEDMNDPSWDRHAEEDKFFKTDPRFNKLPKARVGIESLQTRLREILANIVRKAFPHVRILLEVDLVTSY